MVLQIGAQIAPGVTKDGLLRVRPGMLEDELMLLLGEPLTRTQEGPDSVLVYARPSRWWFGGLSLRVRILERRVEALELKDYGLLVYYCARARGGCQVVWDASTLDRLGVMRWISMHLDTLAPSRRSTVPP